MCKPTDRSKVEEILRDYNAKKVEQKYFVCLNDEITIVVIKYSRLIIISNKLYPDIFNRLKIEKENLFVCNFLNDNYFYVSKCCKNI